MTPAQLSNQIIRLKKALAASRQKAADALVRLSTAKEQARELKRQYKHARKLAKEAKKVAAQAEESVQEQQGLLAKAQKKLLKARNATKHSHVAIVRKRANTTAASSALAKHKAQVPQTQGKSVLPPRPTPAGNLPRISA